MSNLKKWITIVSLAVPIIITMGTLVTGYAFTMEIGGRHAEYHPISGNIPNGKLLYLYNLLTEQTRNEVFVLKKILHVALVVYILNLASLFYYYHFLRNRKNNT